MSVNFYSISNPELLHIIFKNRNIQDNLKYNCIDKNIENVLNDVLFEQINHLKYFNKIKRNTVFPIKFYRKYNRTYYTLKNKYINKEETPVMIF